MKKNLILLSMATYNVINAASGNNIVLLGTASNCTILAKSGISTVPTSAITGNIAVSPVTTITGFSLTLDCTAIYFNIYSARSWPTSGDMDPIGDLSPSSTPSTSIIPSTQPSLSLQPTICVDIYCRPNQHFRNKNGRNRTAVLLLTAFMLWRQYWRHFWGSFF
jgi:hypothetical protein